MTNENYARNGSIVTWEGPRPEYTVLGSKAYCMHAPVAVIQQWTKEAATISVSSAIGRTTGVNWHGTATFKDEFVAMDPCNFSFSNRGKVHLISPGSDVNAVITFDDFVRHDNCVLTAESHVVSFDCRGSGKL